MTGRARLTPHDGAQTLSHAIEIRHPSFVQEQFVELLRDQGVALVVADTAGKWPFLEDVTLDVDEKLYD